MAIRAKALAPKAWAAWQTYDKFDTAKDALVFLSKVVRGQPWDFTTAVFLSLQFIPFGKIFKKLEPFVKAVPIGTPGKLTAAVTSGDEVLDELSRIYKAAGAGTKEAAELIGVKSAAAVAAAKGWQHTDFIAGYHGIDGIFRDQVGNWIIVEAKGAGSNLVKDQMSRTWITSRVKQLVDASQNAGVPQNLKDDLLDALDDVVLNPSSQRLRGMVVKAPVDENDAVKAIEFLEKTWDSINPTTWG